MIKRRIGRLKEFEIALGEIKGIQRVFKGV
jgi:hypothetical protein